MFRMYRCPRLVDVPVVVELPSVMYKMAPFSLKGHDSGPAQLMQTSKGCPAASALEARQEAVLKRLLNLKDQLDRLQSTRTTTATAAATTATAAAATAGGLGAAACSSPLKGYPSDLLRQQESVLYRLGHLKDKLSKISTQAEDVDSCEPASLSTRHQAILKVIGALREELGFLSDLQKWMEQREQQQQEEENKNSRSRNKISSMEEKEMEIEREIEKQHKFVLRKLVALKEELRGIVDKLRRSSESEEEQNALLSVCSCLDLTSDDPTAEIVTSSSHPPSSSSSSSSSSSLFPSSSSFSTDYKTVNSLPSSSSSLFSLLPPPPLLPLPSSSSSSSSSFSSSSFEKTPSSPIQDLVIAASPANPPLSLLVLRRLLGQSGLPVHCSSRLHSSVPQVRPELQAAFTESPLEERSKHSVAFSLQWSDVPSPSLMINPLRQTRIAGEANILRYVTRLLPSTSPYNFEAIGTFTSIAETDSLLDTVEGGLVWGGAKEKAAVMREIGKRLSRSAFLCGGQCGVVDLLAWSLVRQRGAAVDQAVANWLARVDALAGIDLTKITATTTTTTATKQQQKSKPQTATATTATTTREGGEKKVSTQNEKTYLGRKDLEKYLKELGVAFQIKEHQAVMTVEALMDEVEGLPGIVTKNLFLRDKKKTLYILSTRHNTEIDLKTLAKKINSKDLRFADATTLYDTLGVRQGCVTPLALINDPGHTVKVLLETPLVELTTGHIYFHPLSNDASLGLKPAGLQRFLEATGHAPPTLVQL